MKDKNSVAGARPVFWMWVSYTTASRISINKVTLKTRSSALTVVQRWDQNGAIAMLMAGPRVNLLWLRDHYIHTGGVKDTLILIFNHVVK